MKTEKKAIVLKTVDDARAYLTKLSVKAKSAERRLEKDIPNGDDIDLGNPNVKDPEQFEKELAKFKVTKCDNGILLSVKRTDIDWTEDRPMKMNINVGGYPWSPEKPEEAVHSLGKSTLSPCMFGWFMPKKRK